jgi:two-component system sensor histidine kinase AlgZ
VVVWCFPQLANIQDNHWWVMRNLWVAIVVAESCCVIFTCSNSCACRNSLDWRHGSTPAHPHTAAFLFNTLNSIASLIMSRPETAEKAVEDLAELFRSSLKESREPTTVQDEVRLTRLYLGIEELRLGQNALSEITGEFTSDDLLGVIFSRFCIGK